MAFVRVTLDAKEPDTAPEDEYELRIIKIEEKVSGPNSKIPGEPYISAMIRVEGGAAEYKPIFETLMIPTAKTPTEHVDMYKLRIQRFLAVFGIAGDGDGFDTDDFPGATGKCLVIQTDDDYTGDKKNSLRLPRLEAYTPKAKGRKSA